MALLRASIVLNEDKTPVENEGKYTFIADGKREKYIHAFSCKLQIRK